MTSSVRKVVTDRGYIEFELNRSFGLSIVDVHDVATEIYRAFGSVGALHPKGYNGTRAWAVGTHYLRATLIPRGWVPEDPQGQPRIVSPTRKSAITVSSGDACTGVPNKSPHTRNNKGSQTADSVRYNARQYEMFPLTSDDGPAPIPFEGAQSDLTLWFLLYYIDLDVGELRMELSCPTGMSEGDRVNEWSIRYILPSMPLRPDLNEGSGGEPADIDFDVLPKQP